jgi:hypothetical protein
VTVRETRRRWFGRPRVEEPKTEGGEAAAEPEESGALEGSPDAAASQSRGTSTAPAAAGTLPGMAEVDVKTDDREASKTTVTVLSETLLEWQEKLGGSGLQAIDQLRNIYNSGFAEATVQQALRDPDGNVRACVRDFLDRVARET